MSNRAIVLSRGTEQKENTRFPARFRRGLFQGLDRRYLLILLLCAITLYSVVIIMAVRKPSDILDEQEIVKIQERYARLVLNQPLPKAEETPVEKLPAKTAEKSVEKETVVKQVEPDREKESLQQRQKRRASTSEERVQQRQKVARQVQSTGIFAAITSSRGEGTSTIGSMDLLSSSAMSELKTVPVSGTGFLNKESSVKEILSRRSERTTGVTIEKQELGKAQTKQLETTGEVKVASKPPSITASVVDDSQQRSQSSIQRIVNRETQRLKRVYEDWLKRDPRLSGTLTVKFSILPSGEVSDVTLVNSTTGNSQFDDNILRYVQRWRFIASPESGTTEVVYPFVFEGLQG